MEYVALARRDCCLIPSTYHLSTCPAIVDVLSTSHLMACTEGVLRCSAAPPHTQAWCAPQYRVAIRCTMYVVSLQPWRQTGVTLLRMALTLHTEYRVGFPFARGSHRRPPIPVESRASLGFASRTIPGILGRVLRISGAFGAPASPPSPSC